MWPRLDDHVRRGNPPRYPPGMSIPASSASVDAPPAAIVLGGSGAVGRFLLRRVNAEGGRVLALSGQSPPVWSQAWTGVSWIPARLPTQRLSDLPAAPLLLSAGPLDALAVACTLGLPPGLRRVVALSSLSIVWKRASPNPGERALAARLLDAETTLRQITSAAEVELVLLRPGLIYGAGIDRSLSPLLQFARRWRWLPWPTAGRGMRCPVHAEDVALAIWRAATTVSPATQVLALPGPECLPFDQAIDRLLWALAPVSRRLPLPLPDALLRRVARGHGAWAARAATLHRSALDQCAAPDDWDLLGIAPRGFAPRAEDFEPWAQHA